MSLRTPGMTPPSTPPKRSARGDMYMYVRWMTVFVLAIGVVGGLSMPRLFVLRRPSVGELLTAVSK